ncbi:conjugative transposon protein TraJ [Chitinophaga sedimenti]|nr:conjugative transposon protein TraJ [Chitinophaga sedimenti]
MIAAFAAIFYIAYRVWKNIAQAEPIDFYPLLRPFCIGFVITAYPLCLNLMEGILYPTVAATRAMVDEENVVIAKMMEERDKQIKESAAWKMFGSNDGVGDRDVWMEMTHPGESEGPLSWMSNSMSFAMEKAYYNLKYWFKSVIAFLLELLYESAALCINAIRTFNLLIVALLGPFVLALSVFDGLTHTFTVWLSRYINYYLWLPIANILGALLGKIREGMLKMDLEQLANYEDTFFTAADIGYIVFMIIGIAAYFTIPSLSTMVVNTGERSMLTSKVTNMTIGTASQTANSFANSTGMAADAFGNQHVRNTQGTAGAGSNSGYFKDKLNG